MKGGSLREGGRKIYRLPFPSIYQRTVAVRRADSLKSESIRQLAAKNENQNRRKHGRFEIAVAGVLHDTSAGGGAVQRIDTAVSLGCSFR